MATIQVIGSRIREMRDRRGLTQGQLAYKANTTVTQISRLENDERPGSQAVIIARIASALDTTVDYLLGLTDSPFPQRDNEDDLPDCSRCPREMREIVYRLIEVWDEIAEMDETGESLERLLNVVTTQAEAFKAAMRAMQRRESDEPAHNRGES